MTPSDHNQAEYVRGIQAGKRIERQNYVVACAAWIILGLNIGIVVGALLF